MELGGASAFDACLAEAQRLGYAEADPTFDIDGFDTAHKLAILTSLAFGVAVDAEAIHIEGIQSITLEDLNAASDLGYRSFELFLKGLGWKGRKVWPVTEHATSVQVCLALVLVGTRNNVLGPLCGRP